MFQQMLAIQWKSGKIGVGILTVLAFGLPLMAVQNVAVPDNVLGPQGMTADILFMAWEFWLPTFPALAALAGIVLALNAWNWDHKSEHVYPLSLPLSRSQYALLKALAGVALLALPVAALGISSFIAVAITDIPSGLHAYPVLFIGRFALASLLMYMLFFALASSTLRTVGMLVGGFVVAVIALQIGSDFIGMSVDPVEWVVTRMVEWPGPFNVFAGNWMLIDV